MKKYLRIAGALVVVILLGLWWKSSSEPKEVRLETKATLTDFKNLVVSSGEIKALNSENINGPSSLRQVGIWNVKISDLVSEGTFVKAGDYVARLDQTEIATKIRDTQAELEKLESQFIQAQLDTTLTLRTTRDEILNLEYGFQQKKISLEQSAFEPPAIIRQAELDLEKSTRDLKQAKENYNIKSRQAAAKMAEVNVSRQQVMQKLQDMQKLLQEFTIVAPQDGMVIYIKEWNGAKKKVGASISPWDPAVATLPDFSKLLSTTFVNEVDIRKVKVGQLVEIGLDAFPDVKLTGKVKEVANVGEQKQGSDSKVFEVVIELNESDPTYRPGMTTSNKILTGEVKQVVVLPIEAIFSADSLQFVYSKSGTGIKKKQVKVGERNETEVIITEGVIADEVVLLNQPEGMEKEPIKLLESK